ALRSPVSRPQIPPACLRLRWRPAFPATAAKPPRSKAAPPRGIPALQSRAGLPPCAICSWHAAQTPAAHRRAPSRDRRQSRGSCASRPLPSRCARNSRPRPARSRATLSPPKPASPPPRPPRSCSPPPPPISVFGSFFLDLNPQLLQLVPIHFTRRLRHQIHRRRCLRKRNHLAN